MRYIDSIGASKEMLKPHCICPTFTVESTGTLLFGQEIRKVFICWGAEPLPWSVWKRWP